MPKILSSTSSLKNSNLVVLIESLEDVQSLKLEEKILKKVRTSLGEKKSFCHTFFVDHKNYEHIYVLFHSQEDTKEIHDFLAEHITKLPAHLALMAENKQNLLALLDTTVLARYKFHRYKKDKKSDDINLIVSNKKDGEFFQERIEVLENICFARDLGETPTHDLTPEIFANLVKKTKFKNTKVKVLSPKDIEKQGMGLLKGVGFGSQHKPYFVILERIVDKKAPTIGFVGKGVVFDTGGLNIKMPSPIGGMEIMKFDMAGAATVFAVMKQLDQKKLKVNIIAAIPIAENSVGGSAFRPSDILTSYSGKTVQITNTDAEGRLILADGVSYLSKNYKIDRFITIATLTGLCVMTFAHRYAAVMGDDREMLDTLVDYGKTHFEKYWELPFDHHFIEKTKSNIADYDNHTPGAFAGTIMGGAFIYNFRLNKEKFTHIDIASVANIKSGPYGLYPNGVTGFGVDSLSEIFLNLK